MEYKKQAALLSIVTGLLVLGYAAAVIFSPERLNTRSAAYRWLEPQAAEQADGITISGSAGEIPLWRKNGAWFTSAEGGASGGAEGPEYPVKASRVEDLLSILTTRGAYPIRGGAVSHERLGLSGAGPRITVRAANRVLLDLLAGGADASGREIYLRKYNQDEVRSGEDRFTTYLNGALKSWYNLKLFPEGGALDLVQRLTVIAPAEAFADASSATPPLVISRRETGWVVEGLAGEAVDSAKIEPYIRSILDAEGDTFLPAMNAQDPVFNEGRITLEFGDGTSRRIGLGPVLTENQAETGTNSRSAVVSGSSSVYALTEWMVNRIFRDVSYFEKAELPADVPAE